VEKLATTIFCRWSGVENNDAKLAETARSGCDDNLVYFWRRLAVLNGEPSCSCGVQRTERPDVYWNTVENERLADGRLVQRYVLYHGEIDSSQLLASRRTRSRNLGAVDAENA